MQGSQCSHHITGVGAYCCTATNDQLYHFGGYCGHDDCFHNSITQLDTVSLQWRELEPTDAIKPVMRRGSGGMISFELHGVTPFTNHRRAWI